MNVGVPFSSLRLWARVQDSVLKTIHVHHKSLTEKTFSIPGQVGLRVQTYGLPAAVAEALDGSLGVDPDCEWIHHDDGGLAGVTVDSASAWDVVLVGGEEILLRGLDWLENLVRMTPDQPIMVVVSESGSDLVGRVLEAGATECLLESEVTAGMVKEAIRDAITQKGIEKEVRALSAVPSNVTVNDRLTGLISSRMAEEFLETEFRSAARGDRDVACLLIHIDGIDGIAESYGAAFTNVVLREVGTSLKRSVRHADLLSRLNGAEFLIVLPGANVVQAVRRGRQIAQSMMGKEVVIFDETIPLVVRIGVASRKTSNASGPDVLIDLARKALDGPAENQDGLPVSVWT